MVDLRTARHTFGSGEQTKLDFRVGDRVDGQIVQFRTGFDTTGGLLVEVILGLSALLDEQRLTNTYLQSIVGEKLEIESN